MTATDYNGVLYSAFNPANTPMTLNEAMYRWAISQGLGAVSVLQFAAAGVTINNGTTDARATIQSAIDAVYTAGGGIIYMPQGVYKVTPASTSASGGCIVLKDNCYLVGAGQRLTTILLAAGTSQKLTGIVRTPSSVVTRNAGIMNLTIDGNRADVNRAVKSLTQTGGLATAIAPGHTLVTGDTIYTSGAVDTLYNSTFVVTVIDRNTFTFSISASAAAIAYGTIVYTVTGQGFAITGITRSSTTATVITSAAHGLSSGDDVLVTGAAQAGYNGVVTVTVSDATTFTYTVDVATVTPATTTTRLLFSYVHDGFFCGVSPSLFVTGGIANVSGNTYRMTVASGHGIVVGSYFSIQNATTVAYNGEWVCTAKTATTVDFTITGSPASESGGANATAVFYPTTLSNASDYDISCVNVEMRYMTHYGFDPHEITTRLIMDSNRSHSNGLDGFVADSIIDGAYRNNYAYNNGRHGFNLTTSSNDLMVLGCFGYDNGVLELGAGGNGIVVQRGSSNLPFPYKIIISGGAYLRNRLNNIKLQMANQVLITEVLCTDAYNQGIRILGSTDINIVGNILRDNGSAANNTYDDIQIDEYNAAFGVGTVGSQYVTVSDNNIRATGTNKTRYGIREETSASDNNVFSMNSIIGNVNSDSISASGANTTVLAVAGQGVSTTPGATKVPILVVTTSGTTKTISKSDANTMQNCTNASGCAVTIPLNSSTAYKIGTRILFQQSGAAAVSLVATGGVTLNSPNGVLTSSYLYQVFSIIKTATDTWTVEGLIPALSITKLATITGINSKSTGATALYTVPTGKTAIITEAFVRCTAASAITVGASASIGQNSTAFDDFVGITILTALLATTDAFPLRATAKFVQAAAAAVVNIKITTAATGTSQTLAVDLYGYLV